MENITLNTASTHNALRVINACCLRKRSFMKYFTLLIFGALLTSASIVRAEVGGDQQQTLWKCRSAAPAWDHGYFVTIQDGGLSGLTLAKVSAQSFEGPRSLGTYAVDAIHGFASEKIEGNGFHLSISTVQSEG